MTLSMTVYCDSQSVLDRITKLQGPMNQSAQTMITDDYDVYAMIVSTLHNLHPISITFLHVKGHQD